LLGFEFQSYQVEFKRLGETKPAVSLMLDLKWAKNLSTSTSSLEATKI
jgi:hypothetical protein